MLGAKAASLHLIDMLEQQVQDAFSADGIFQLDETIADFQQGYAADQEINSASNDGFEDAIPSDMLTDDLSLLDWAVCKLEDLIILASKEWNDRHSGFDTTPPISWRTPVQPIVPGMT